MDQTSENGIRIISFEPRYQAQAVALFAQGLCDSYKNSVDAHIAQAQREFVEDKLQPMGDMHDIQKSFMSDSKIKHFWVAVNADDKVLGIVGASPSTYKEDLDVVYGSGEERISPSEVIELIRMSVSNEVRGCGLGRRLCCTVEQFGRAAGMKKVVLSTLAAMHLAQGLYRHCGYELLFSTKAERTDMELIITHFGKSL